jgi:hypothetical protein
MEKKKPTKAYLYCVDMIIKASQKCVKKPDSCDDSFYDKVYDKIEKLIPKMSLKEKQLISKLVIGL